MKKFKRILSFLMSALVMTSVGNNICLTNAYAEENFNTNIDLSINWKGKEDNLNIDLSDSSAQSTQSLTEVIKYKSQKVDKDYGIGDLAISVDTLNILKGNKKVSFDIASDKAGTPANEQIYDWSYTYNATQHKIVFTNNKPIAKDSVLDGFFEIVWTFYSNNVRAGCKQDNIKAILYYPDGSINESNKLSLKIKTTKEKYWLNVNMTNLDSDRGLEQYVDNKDDYILYKYTIDLGRSIGQQLLLTKRYVLSLEEGAVICQNNVSANGNKISLDYFKENYIYIAYPKTYIDKETTFKVEMYGTYEEENVEEKIAEREKKYTLKEEDGKYFGGNGGYFAYSLNIDRFSSYMLNCSRIRTSNGADYSYNIEWVNEGKFYASSMQIVNDIPLVPQDDGTYKQLEEDKYNLKCITMPDKIVANDIEVKDIEFTVYGCKSSTFSKQNSIFIKKFKIGEIKKVEFPSNIHSFGVDINFEKEVTNLSEIVINVKANFHNLDLKESDKIGNNVFCKTFHKNVNGLFSDCTIPNNNNKVYYNGFDIEKFDKDNYKNLGVHFDIVKQTGVVSRANNYINLYTTKNDATNYTKVSQEQVGNKMIANVKSQQQIKVVEDTSENIQFSNYILLPEGMELLYGRDNEDFIEHFNIPKKYLDYCKINIDKNYKDSQRTYIEFKFDIPKGEYSNINIDYNFDTFIDIDKFVDGSYKGDIYSNTILDNILLGKTSGKEKDNGEYAYNSVDKLLLEDINNNGDKEELIDVSKYILNLSLPNSGQYSISKTIKGSEDLYYNNETTTEVGKNYTYRLEIKNGSSVLSDIVITDDVEALTGTHGKLNSITVSKGFTITTERKESLNGGIGLYTIKLDKPLKAGQNVYIYLNMTLDKENNLIGKTIQNNFNLKGNMKNELDETVLEVNTTSNIATATITPLHSKITLTKKDATNNSVLSGAKISLYKEEDLANPIDTQITNNEGKIIFRNLEGVKKYFIKEIEAPKGYILDTGLKEVNVDEENIIYDFINNRVLGKIKVEKVNNLDNDVKVSGGVYSLYKYNKETDEREFLLDKTTDENGELYFDNLQWGDYLVKEKTSAIGYDIDTNEYKITIDRNNCEEPQNITSLEPQQLKTVTITKKVEKVDGTKTDTVMPNCRFVLYKIGINNVVINKEIGTYITDNNGQIILGDLSYGKYKLVEKSAPLGYSLCKDYEFELKPEDTDKNIVLYDKERAGSVGINKRDKNDNPIENAKFSIYSKGDLSNPLQTITTDVNGNGVFDNLQWGEYVIKEIEAPEGYVLDNNPINITIDGNHIVHVLKCVNNEKLGSVKLIKVDKDDHTKLLEGAEFDIFDNSGKKINTETIRTNENGEVIINNLAWGTYYIQETKAPQGYSLSSDKRIFVINRYNANAIQNITLENSVDQSGKVKIEVVVNPDDTNLDHGELDFIFDITYKLDDKTITKTVTTNFNETDNRREIIVPEIPITAKEIVVKEIVPQRYVVDDDEKEVELIDGEGEVIFENRKIDWTNLSYSNLINNHFSSKSKMTGITAKFNHEGFVEANTNINRDELEVYVLYDNGDRKKLENDEYTLSTNKWVNKAGDYAVNVTYQGFSATFVGTIDENSVIVGAELTNDYLSNVDSEIENANQIIFTSILPSEGIQTFDFSINKDNSIIGWAEGDNYYISNKNPALPIVFPENCSGMFQAYKLTKIVADVSIDTKKVTDMSYMFSSTWRGGNLADITALADWDTSNVTNMKSMFSGTKITDITALKDWDLSNVTDMSYMFNYCTSLIDINLDDLELKNVTNMSYMFGKQDNDDIGMKIKTFSMRNLVANKLTHIYEFIGFIGSCDAETIDLSNWKVNSLKELRSEFIKCNNEKTLAILDNWEADNLTEIHDIVVNNLSMKNLKASKLEDISYMLSSASEIDLENWETNIKNIKNISYLFYQNDRITNLDCLNQIKNCIDNVTDMSSMFYDCSSLTDITALANLDTSNVTDMHRTSYMFSECTNLKGTILLFTKYIGERMFYNCSNIDCIIIPNTTKKIYTYNQPLKNVKAILNASDIPTDSSYWGALSCIDPDTDSRITRVEIEKATCIENGLTAYTYTWDNGLYTWEGKSNPLGHSFGEWITDIEPTDTVAGSKHHICERCNEREDAEIDALGHSFGEWIVDREPTDTVAGIKYHICERCNEREEKEFFNPTYWQNTVNNSYCFTQGTGSNEYLWTSTNKGRNSTTAISEWTINLTHNAEYDLEYSVSSERNYDKLSIFLDETKLLEVSGEENGNKKINLTAGTHTLKAQYSKDSSSHSGDDQAIINLKPVE